MNQVVLGRLRNPSTTTDHLAGVAGLYQFVLMMIGSSRRIEIEHTDLMSMAGMGDTSELLVFHMELTVVWASGRCTPRRQAAARTLYVMSMARSWKIRQDQSQT